MEDLRKIKSKELLKDAFWRVLASKKYAQIFIKDIVEEAGVNRKTFTAHYESVDALMRDCIDEFVHQMFFPFDYPHLSDFFSFSCSTHEYTRFALENRQRLQLIFSNQLDGLALHLWKDSLIATGISSNDSPSASPTGSSEDNDLRYDLYLNYAIYSCWGNLLWILDHADLPLDKLVDEALDVYRIHLKDSSLLYKTSEQ